MPELEKKLHETKTLIPEVPQRLDIKMEERIDGATKVKRPLNLRFRFVLATAIVACVALSATTIALFSHTQKEQQQLFHKLPQSKVLMNLDDDLVNRTAIKAVEKLSPFLTDEKAEDTVLSPATYSLAMAGLSAVSDNFNYDAFGLINAEEDVKALLEAWNFKFKNYTGETFFRSAVLHQQVGPTYAFDKSKQEAVSDHYISTMVSSHESYRKDADKFFDKKIGLKLKVPDLNLKSDGVVTYGVLKMKDYVANDGLFHRHMPFTFKSGLGTADSYVFAVREDPKKVAYYRGGNYEVFKVNIRNTDLMIVLPNEEVNINHVNITEAYTNFVNEAELVPAFGYVPFFHNKVEGLNLTDTLENVITHNEIYMSKLLKDDVYNDLVIDAVVQSNDFEFNKYGVAGESMTAVSGCTSTGPLYDEPIDLSVNRPFYAFSLKDKYPIFINKVSKPGA